MNISTSECSSGCQSGWTMYLDQSSNSADQYHRAGFMIDDEDYRNKGENVEEEEEEDEDLSIVSDASSGPPPHFHENEDCFDQSGYFSFASEQANNNKKKQKSRTKLIGKQQNSYLDDTASSPFLSFSKKNIDVSNNEASMQRAHGFSQGSSTTHFKGESALKQHFGLLQPSGPGKAASEKSGGLQGRKRRQ